MGITFPLALMFLWTCLIGYVPASDCDSRPSFEKNFPLSVIGETDGDGFVHYTPSLHDPDFDLKPVLWATAVASEVTGWERYQNALTDWGWTVRYLSNRSNEGHGRPVGLIVTAPGEQKTSHAIFAFRGLEGVGEQMAYTPQVSLSINGYYMPTLHTNYTAPFKNLWPRFTRQVHDGNVHGGLYTHFADHIGPKLKGAIESLFAAHNDCFNLNLIFTGFGAGGAFAQFAALGVLHHDLDYQGHCWNVRNRLQIVTFGSQCPFDSAGADGFNGIIGAENHLAFSITQDASSYKTPWGVPAGTAISFSPTDYLTQKGQQLLSNPVQTGFSLGMTAVAGYVGGFFGMIAGGAQMMATGLHDVSPYLDGARKALTDYRKKRFPPQGHGFYGATTDDPSSSTNGQTEDNEQNGSAIHYEIKWRE